MTSPYLLADLKRFEGCRLTSYWDAIGKCWTIGWGHTGKDVVKGMTIAQATADLWLATDVGHAIRALDSDPATAGWWREMPAARQDALAELSFNLGERTLDEFVHTLAALKAGDYAAAAREAAESKWYAQVNGDGRGDFVCTLILSGRRPGDKETPP